MMRTENSFMEFIHLLFVSSTPLRACASNVMVGVVMLLIGPTLSFLLDSVPNGRPAATPLSLDDWTSAISPITPFPYHGLGGAGRMCWLTHHKNATGGNSPGGPLRSDTKPPTLCNQVILPF